jgi:hypothetical protein
VSFGEQKQRGRPATVAERVAKHVAKHSLVERRQCADPKRRIRLERNQAKWLMHYCPETFSRAFDRAHLRIIEGVMEAHKSGGRFAVAGERGIGKSAVLYGMVGLLALSGVEKFPIYLPWASTTMRRGLLFWKNLLAYNERILADYPEYAAPFAHAKGYANRMHALRWSDTEEPTGALLQISDGMIVLPDSRGVIGASTINGNPRGINLPRSDGSVLRPSIALIDDPQSREVAKSTLQVIDTLAKIDGDVGGLGTSGAAFPILLSGNCIAQDDVMARILADDNWKSLRVSCVESWPAGWAEQGPAYKLWQEWWTTYRIQPKAAVQFYRKNRKAMTSGMVLTAPKAYRAQVNAFLPDALCVAMRQYWQLGHNAFMAERQQMPENMVVTAYELTAEAVRDKTSGMKKGNAMYSEAVVIGADVNYSGVNWVMLAAKMDHAGQLVDFGKVPEGGAMLIERGGQKEADGRLISSAIITLAKRLTDYPVKLADGKTRFPDMLLVDCGFWTDVILDTIAAIRLPMKVMAIRGRAADKYTPKRNSLKIGDNWHVVKWDRGPAMIINADYWLEATQRAFLVPTGAPGSLCVPDGMDCRRFAAEMTAERLAEHVSTNKGEYYKWAMQPGTQNDLGDACKYAFAGCSLLGASLTGVRAPRAPARKRAAQTGSRRPSRICSTPMEA